MLRPSPNHGTQRLPNDDDDEVILEPMNNIFHISILLSVVVNDMGIFNRLMMLLF